MHGCHAVDRKLVGPSFKDIAARYKADPQAVQAVEEGEGGRLGRLGRHSDARAPAHERRRRAFGGRMGAGWRAVKVRFQGRFNPYCQAQKCVCMMVDCWGGSSAGRASRSQCEGREFDPPLHQRNSKASIARSPFCFAGPAMAGRTRAALDVAGAGGRSSQVSSSCASLNVGTPNAANPTVITARITVLFRSSAKMTNDSA